MTAPDRGDDGWREVMVSNGPVREEKISPQGLSDVPSFERDPVYEAERQHRWAELDRRRLKRTLIESSLLLLLVGWLVAGPSWVGYASALLVAGPVLGFVLHRSANEPYTVGLHGFLVFAIWHASDVLLFDAEPILGMGGGGAVRVLMVKALIMAAVFGLYGQRRRMRMMEGGA